MKKILITIIAVAMSAIAYAGNPQIKFKETSFDFGNIREAEGPVSHDFIIENVGTDPLIIISASASCGCTTPVIPKEPIKPGASAKIRVTFDPAGRPGDFDKTIRVKSNTKEKRKNIKITGCVIPKK